MFSGVNSGGCPNGPGAAASYCADAIVVGVGVLVGVGVVVGLGPVVDDVEGVPQQKPTSSGASCTSRGLHAARIFTEPLNVPSLRTRAHSAAACAVVTVPARATVSRPMRAGQPGGNAMAGSYSPGSALVNPNVPACLAERHAIALERPA